MFPCTEIQWMEHAYAGLTWQKKNRLKRWRSIFPLPFYKEKGLHALAFFSLSPAFPHSVYFPLPNLPKRFSRYRDNYRDRIPFVLHELSILHITQQTTWIIWYCRLQRPREWTKCRGTGTAKRMSSYLFLRLMKMPRRTFYSTHPPTP